jgi:hypothetical protein
MLIAPAQARHSFWQQAHLLQARRGGGLQKRAWSQEAWLSGGVAKAAGGVTRPDVPQAAPALVQSRAVVRRRTADPLHALRSPLSAKARQPRPRSSATMSKLARLEREEIMECQVMWEPDSKKDTQMDRFRAAVGTACGLALGEYGARG